MRTIFLSTLRLSVIAMTLSGCGSEGTVVPVAPPMIAPTSAGGQHDPATGGPAEPHVDKIHHLLTIESDIAGSSAQSVSFDIELMVDSNNRFVVLNAHRQGSRRPALPPGGGMGTTEIRSRICEDNLNAGAVNCNADLEQMTGEGIVLAKFLNRPGIVLKLDPKFSPSEGGYLDMHFIKKADIDDARKDQNARYRMHLEPTRGGWILLSALTRGKGSFGLMKIHSNFSGLFANGIRWIEVGNNENNLW